MSRIAAALVTATTLLAAPIANACFCLPPLSQADADRAGEQVWRNAALIVDATVGPESAAYTETCRSPDARSRAIAIGERIDSDRMLTVHRTFKGRPPKRLVLAGEQTITALAGCEIRSTDCHTRIESGGRAIFILMRVNGGRYRMADNCSQYALSLSARGRGLFGVK